MNALPDFVSSPALWTVVGSGVLSAIVSQYMTRRTNIRVERLKSSLEHGRIVSKAQLDVELGAYQILWQAVANFVIHMNTFVAVPAIADRNIPKADHKKFMAEMAKVNYANMMEPQNQLANAVQHNQPFLAAEIYAPAISFASEASRIYGELFSDVGGTFLSEEWWVLRRVWADDLTVRSTQIAELIRKRLEQLRVAF